MCGIAGKVTSAERVEPALIERMCQTLVHRGPDAYGAHCDGPVGLGMRRLAVIDLEHGDQPIYSEDRQLVLVFNGEIYNHRSLREALVSRGHRFAGGSDAEVVVHLWEELGPSAIEQLRGMFAFALWDAGARRLHLARDRLGKKPLFYALRDGALSFGSEPRALLEDPAVPRDIDPQAIDAYLVNQYVPHHLSAFRSLRKLAPATLLSWKPGGEPRTERYWRLLYEPKRELGYDEAAERLRELILEATRLRLISDVPLGAFLSGGVDSSAIVAAMAQSSSQPVKTFAVKFPYLDFDESPYARAVAEHLCTDHVELEVGVPDPELLTKMAWHYGEPFADPAALPTFQLSELTRRQVTVALAGDGGDESFAGYRRYWQLAATLAADRVPAPLRRALADALSSVAGDREGRAALPRLARLGRRLALAPAHRYADLFRYFTEADRRAAYGPALRETLGADPLEHYVRAFTAHPRGNAFDRLMGVDLDTYLPDDLLAKVDIASMAYSLEVRAPLLDQELVEFAARLPPRYKARGRAGKLLLRDAVREWLPPGLLDRPKHGFAVPIAAWLRGELHEFTKEVLLDRVAVERGVFERHAVERLIAEHAAGAERSLQLWAMLNLELWFTTCVDVTGGRPSAVSVAP